MARQWNRLGAVLTILCATATGGADAADDPVPYCTGRVDQAHVSQLAPGIIVKGFYTCTSGVSRLTYSLHLYRCDQKPYGEPGEWAQYGCAIVATGAGAQNPPIAGKEYGQYAPERTLPGMTGCGWWIGYSSYSWAVGTAPFIRYIWSNDSRALCFTLF